jgi:hypothetical protein
MMHEYWVRKYTNLLKAGVITMHDLKERAQDGRISSDLLAAVAAAWDDKQETETND